MVKTIDIVNEAKRIANLGIGVDQDGAYGTQCVDLPNYLSVLFFGKALRGNAIDLLNSAKSLGYTVEYNVVGDVNSKPRAGAVFVMDTTYIAGHSYGHTGLVIADSDGYTMSTIEQNVDGNADSLYVGGPARYRNRDFSGIVGWFYFPVNDTPANNPANTDLQALDKARTFKVTVDKLNVRSAPSLDSEVVATYENGEEFNYMEYCYANGYEWLSYISHSGERRYVASMELETGKEYGEWRYRD
ncbi:MULTISPECIES: CHAP domain-containing protein [Gemella]|uniref:CHAP domain-containing protein n=1 Tax=Gemella TaxID=1378 RepID=UPI0007682006|nr:MULTISPECIES: CHAP domain-containing protein [Gemella]AME09651.1 cell wall hydrolase [Gemella sp. oral taxon 928]AXI27252.1 cell wall hydrolase [Gemella sp. ND 6198]